MRVRVGVPCGLIPTGPLDDAVRRPCHQSGVGRHWSGILLVAGRQFSHHGVSPWLAYRVSTRAAAKAPALAVASLGQCRCHTLDSYQQSGRTAPNRSVWHVSRRPRSLTGMARVSAIAPLLRLGHDGECSQHLPAGLSPAAPPCRFSVVSQRQQPYRPLSRGIGPCRRPSATRRELPL